ncbi:MAG TPA: FecR domain-containing protein [Sunxiuqinia sp.]|nr:FecR domain-containing protein [Sunxiuqinia sp.]
MNNPEKLFELFYAILSDTASPEEHARFDGLMGDEETKRLFDQTKRIWNESSKAKAGKTYDSRRALFEMKQKIQRKRSIKKRYLSIAVISAAASILLMLGLFNLIDLSQSGREDQSIVSFQTELGNRSCVVLPDSTKVWLNAKSKIYYSSNFGKSDRTVTLKGEGFFDVTHSAQPFIVNVNDFKITVHGTKFNVSAYSEDQKILTSLERGKISIEKKGKQDIVVKPGQLVIYNKKSAKFEVKQVDVSQYSAWRENKMYLHAEPLDDLAAKLERKFNIQIHFTPTRLGEDLHYSGVFSDENVEEVLDAISIASDLQYTKNGNQYNIRANSN